MEAVEVLSAAAPPRRNKDLSPIAKGKRTKRLRPHSPIPFTITTPTHNNHNHNLLRRSPVASAASSDESTTTEDVDTARCLILLSRGYFSTTTQNQPPNNNNNNSPSMHSPATAAAKGGGACVYTCKTCNRSFPSFQALGGHRASHKKPRNEKRTVVFSDEEDFPSPSSKHRFSLNSLSLQLSNASTTTTFSAATLKSSPSPRIHECSYCGAEFTSGQALGGHMRKHRAGPVIRSPEIVPLAEEVEPDESKKLAGNGNGLSLDLNLLPAPEDEKEKSPKQTNHRPRPGFAHHYYSTID